MSLRCKSTVHLFIVIMCFYTMYSIKFYLCIGSASDSIHPSYNNPRRTAPFTNAAQKNTILGMIYYIILVNIIVV